MVRSLAIAGGVLIGGVLLLFAGYACWIHPGYEAVEFSKQAWLSADPEGRGHMVRSLLANEDLEGMPYGAVLELLGEPDGVTTVAEMYSRDHGVVSTEQLQEWFGTNDDAYPHHVTYDIGYLGFRPEAPFVFSYTLHVVFRDGAVTTVYVDD